MLDRGDFVTLARFTEAGNPRPNRKVTATQMNSVRNASSGGKFVRYSVTIVGMDMPTFMRLLVSRYTAEAAAHNPLAGPPVRMPHTYYDINVSHDTSGEVAYRSFIHWWLQYGQPAVFRLSSPPRRQWQLRCAAAMARRTAVAGIAGVAGGPEC